MAVGGEGIRCGPSINVTLSVSVGVGVGVGDLSGGRRVGPAAVAAASSSITILLFIGGSHCAGSGPLGHPGVSRRVSDALSAVDGPRRRP